MSAEFAASFNGSSNYLVAPNYTGNPTVFSVGMWVYLNTTQDQVVFFSNYQTTGSFGWAPGISDTLNNQLKFYLGSATLASGTVLTNATWYYVVFTYDGTTAKIWLNGSSTPDCSLTSALSYGSVPTSNYLGRLEGVSPQYLNGLLAAVGFWTKALSTAEMASLYNAGKGRAFADLSGTLLTGLVSYQDFTSSGNLGLDQSGNGNDYTNTGTVTQVPGPGQRYGLKITSTTDQLVITPNPLTGGIESFALAGLLQFDTGSLSLGSGFAVLFSQVGSGTPNNVVALILSSAANPLTFPSAPASNFLVLYLGNGHGQFQEWVLQLDPFSGFDGDGLRHPFMLEWSALTGGSSILRVGTLGGSMTTYNSSQWLQTANGNFATNPLATSSANLTLGTNDVAWNALVGLTYADFAIYHKPVYGSGYFTDSGTFNDVSNFAAGIPAEVIEASASVDVFPFDNASPTIGFRSVLTGTITGTSRVAGPTLGPTYAASASFSHNATAHDAGSSVLTITAGAGWAPGSPVTFTPSVPGAGYSWSPTTIVLGTGAGASGTARLTIPLGVTIPSTVQVDITNNGGVAPFSQTLSLINPSAFLATANPLGGPGAAVMPNGNIVCLFFKDGSGNPTPVTGADFTGATLTKNGGSPIDLTGITVAYDGVGSRGDNFAWFFAGQPDQIQILDDANATLAGSGWTTASEQSSLNQNFNPAWFADDGAGSLQFSTDPAATATYAFTGLIPGAAYVVSRNSPDQYPGFPGAARLNHGTPTTHAQYAITDGTTTTNHAVDDTIVGSFDRCDALYRWTDIATVTPVGSTLTITLTNAAGTGTLYADGIRIELIPVPFMQSGDTVVLSLPDSAISTTAGAIGPMVGGQAITLILATTQTNPPASTDWFVFDPSLPRNMGLGYNFGTQNVPANVPNQVFAARNKWMFEFGGGGVSIDGNYEMSGISATPGATASLNPIASSQDTIDQGNGDDMWGWPLAPITGAWSFLFDTPGHPTVTMVGLDNSTSVSSAYSGGPGTGIVFQQTPTYGLVPMYSPGLKLNCVSSGSTNDYITNLRIFDPQTPSNWPHTTHPATYNRLHGNFPTGFLRCVNLGFYNGSNVYNWTDHHPTTHFTYAFDGSTPTSSVMSVGPVSGSPASALALNLYELFHGLAVIQVEFTAPHSFHDGQQANFNNFSGNPLDTLGGNITFQFGWIVVVDSTTVLLQVTTSSPTTPVTPTTLAAPMTLGGSETISVSIDDKCSPPQDNLAICNEVGMNLWFQTSLPVSDAYCLTAGAYFAANLAAGKKIAVELSNEIWNTSAAGHNKSIAYIMTGRQNYLWNSTGGAQGAPLASLGHWTAWRSGQIHSLIRAGYTGDQPDVRITGYGTGATAKATVVAGVVTGYVVTNGGTGYTSVPTVLVQGVGTGATGTAVISGGSVTGIMLGSGGSGYTATGRPASDIIRVMPSFGGDTDVTTQIADACNEFNIGFDWLAITTYQDNDPWNGSYGDTIPSTVGALYNACSAEDHLDLFGLHALYTDASAIYKTHPIVLNNKGIHGIELVAYEGGAGLLVQYGDNTYRRAHQVQRSPRYYQFELARLQQIEQTYKFTQECRYTLDGTDFLALGVGWNTYVANENADGTGTAGENAQPYDQRAIVSEEGGARVFYASSAPSSNALPVAFVAMAGHSPTIHGTGVATYAL
jgi:hypothetical protein